MGGCTSKKQKQVIVASTLVKPFEPLDIEQAHQFSFSQRPNKNQPQAEPNEDQWPDQVKDPQDESLSQANDYDDEVLSRESYNSQSSRKGGTRKVKKKKKVKKSTQKRKEVRVDIRTGQMIQQMSSHNFLSDLNEIAQSSSFNPAGDYQHAPSSKFSRPTPKGQMSRKISDESVLESVAESEYRYIPNNFKMKEGVAFQVTGSKINFDAGLSGIYNMGNTCFMSTAVQCLSAVQPLSDFFIGDLHQVTLNKTNPMGSGGNVTMKFANLIKQLWSGKESKVYPLEFIKTLGVYASHLVSGAQQDAQEFLAYLLDVLHEDLNRADKQANLQLKNLLTKDDDGPPEMQQLTEEQQELIAYESWKEHLFNNRSIIVDLFQGQLKSTLTCLKCLYVSIKFDTFMYLSVPVPQNMFQKPNLEQCVQEFTREEILDNEDRWKCPRCRSQQKSKKKIDIWKLPSILIVHLKRFEFSETKKGKIKDFVDFPIKNLDLTPYVSKLQRDKPIYDLFAVCNHEGFLGGGHYYSYTKHRHNQQWYQFNDEIVSAIKKESEVVSSDAYILFYSKMSVDEFCRQTLSEPGLWPHIILQEVKKTTQVSIQKKPTAKIDISAAFGQAQKSQTIQQGSPTFKSQLIPTKFEQKSDRTIDQEDVDMRLNTNNTASKMSFIDHQFTPIKLRGDEIPYSYQTTQPFEADRFKTGLSDYNNPKEQFTRNRQYNSTVGPQRLQGPLAATGNQMMSSQNIKTSTITRDSSHQNFVNSQSPPIHQQYNNLQSLNYAQKKQPFVINNNSNNYYINMYMRSNDKEPQY